MYHCCALHCGRYINCSVASLGWVTPGAATEGVTPLFFPEKPGDLFFSSLSLSLWSLFIAFTPVSPPPGCHPTPFFVSALLFVNLPTNCFSFGCHPLEGVTRGGPPPSYATATVVCQTDAINVGINTQQWSPAALAAAAGLNVSNDGVIGQLLQLTCQQICSRVSY